MIVTNDDKERIEQDARDLVERLNRLELTKLSITVFPACSSTSWLVTAVKQSDRDMTIE